MSRTVPKGLLISEIESALRSGSGEKRIQVLMSVTDLFIGGAADYTEDQTKFFDEVMVHLVKHVESRALAELSARLAPIPNAPIGTIQNLARNDTIEVAGPILANSIRLSDADLIDIAKSKSQAHLVRIAGRPQINEAVTAVLVDKGNADVVNEVAINAGARLSRLTMEKLVMRADGDERLTGSMSRRPDIPPAILRNLMVQATDTVRKKLLALSAPEHRAIVQQVLDELSAEIVKKPPPVRNYAEARRAIAAFSQDSNLARIKILEFANASRIAEMIAALSVLTGVPAEQIERLFQASNPFGLMVLCKSIMLDWNAAYAVVTAREDLLESRAIPYDDLYGQYDELSAQSAQQLLRFWMGRERAVRNFRQAQDAALH